MKRRGFALRDFLDKPVEFAGRSLVEAGLALQPKEADRLQQAQRADRIDICGVFRRLEADSNMALRAEVVDLVRFDFTNDASQVRSV